MLDTMVAHCDLEWDKSNLKVSSNYAFTPNSTCYLYGRLLKTIYA